jgi:hypothetical protein
MDTDNDDTLSNGNGQSNGIQSTLSEDLSIEDWSDIENVRSIFLSIFQKRCSSRKSYDASDRISALVSWSKFASERALKLINFFQHIDEFENLNGDDRFTLIKYNLLPLFLIQKCLCFDPITGTFINAKQEDASKRNQFFTLCYGTSGIRETHLSLVRSLSIVTEQDTTLVSLLLIILLFSKGLSMSENEPLLNDVLAVNRAHSHYTKLMWNYLLYKQGEKKTYKQFIQLMREIARIQSFTQSFRDFFRTQIQSTDALERFEPLMQALLNIN